MARPEMIATNEKCLPEEELLDLAQSVTMFESIARDDILALLRTTEVLRLHPGQTLIEHGSLATAAYLVVLGELEVLADTDDAPVLVGVRNRGDLVGEMALLTHARRNATLRAKTEVCLLRIQDMHLQPWLHQHPAAIVNILKTSVVRMKSAEADMVQHQHLASLGTLAAGLAHELNNPASALLRSAGQLASTVESWERAAWHIGQQATGSTIDVLQHLRAAIADAQGHKSDLDAFARADREQELQQWLERIGDQPAWEVAPILVDRGWTLERLQTALIDVPAEQQSDIIGWIAHGSHVHGLLHELRLSAQVIGDLVSAIKSYSRLDEAPVQLIDVHDGIEQSLVILKHQLRGIAIVRDIDDRIPRMTAHAPQLNQLWTNLIDNAAGAMNGSGTLTIRSRLDDGMAVIDIEDTGPGIPPDVQSRLFEPFFTTKPPGKGTGLGLAISYSTVRKHGGTIQVVSEPGHTRFRVRLPIDRD